MGLILVRYGEIGTKGKNRLEFVRQLRQNMRQALKRRHLEGRVWSEEQRVYVETDALEEALEVLRKVFGIVSLSPVAQTPAVLDAMVAEAVCQARLAGLDASCSFRVAARRADKSFPLTSPEVNSMLGAAVNEATGARVDLSDQADVTLGVEIQKDRVLIYARVVSAWGGMPVGTQGKVLALMSGGIDSPVAAWLMMKRGCRVIPLHFAQSEAQQAKLMELCQVLQEYSAGFAIRPVILDHAQALGELPCRLAELRQERWTCVFCKRTMLLKAAEVAAELGATAVVMGDSLGQVASQTLENMVAISQAVPILILRPLIGWDKVEVVELARRIGTYGISACQAGACPFLPHNPLTRATSQGLEDVLQALADGVAASPQPPG